MARQLILQNLMKLAQGIGANPQKFMGTRTNISFLGKGPTKNPLFQGPLRGIESATEAQLGPRETIIEAVEDAMGFASANKLNSIQIRALELNLEGLNKIYNPPVLPSATVTPIATGLEGLTRVLKTRFPKESHKFFGRPLKDKDFTEIDRLVAEGKLPPMVDKMPLTRNTPLTAEELAKLRNVKPTRIPENIPPASAMMEEMGVELPQKTASARATMIRLLDVYAGGREGAGITLREMMSPQELKWLMEGGGGAKGDPITLFTKFYGNAATRSLPSGGTPGVIDAFAKRLIHAKDTMGRRVDDPFFNPDDAVFAHGGLAHILKVPRTGYFEGALADTKEGKAMSPGTSAKGGTHEGGYGRDDVPLGNNTVVTKPNWITKSNIQPIVETKKSGFGFNYPSGNVGLQALTNLGRIRATTDLSHLLEGDDLQPTFTYDHTLGPATINATYSPDVKSIDVALSKGNWSGGATYDANTGTNFGIKWSKTLGGPKRNYKKGGLAGILEV